MIPIIHAAEFRACVIVAYRLTAPLLLLVYSLFRSCMLFAPAVRVELFLFLRAVLSQRAYVQVFGKWERYHIALVRRNKRCR